MAGYNLDYIISAVDKFTPALSRITNEIKDAQGRMGGFTTAMNKWGHGLQDVGMAMTKYVTAPIIAAGTAALYESSRFEEFAHTLRYVTGSAVAGQVALDDLVKFSARSPFKIENLVGATKTLWNMGFSADKARTMLEGLGDIAAGSGADIDQLAFSFGRVAMRGRMTSRELLQFTHMGIPMKAMAKSMGMSTQQMAMLAQKGLITATQVQHAFNAMSGKGGIFHGAMAEEMDHISVAFSKTREAIEHMLARLGDIIKVSLGVVPALTTVAGVINGLTDRMVAFASAHPLLTKLLIWAALFAAALGPVVAGVGALIISIGAIVASLPGFMVGLAALGTLGAAAAPVLAVAGAVAALSAAVYELVTNWKTLTDLGGWKDLWHAATGQMPAYTGPQRPGMSGYPGGPGVAVQQGGSNSSFNGKLEIVAPHGSVKKMTSETHGAGSFDVGLNMAGAGGY